MENLKEYFQKSQRWLPCVGKAPRRIRTSSIDWNIIGNQYTAKEVWEYKKDNPAIGWGTVVFKNDPLIVVDIDGLTDSGIDYINRFNTLPLANTAVSTVLDKLTIKDTLVEKSLSGKGLHIYLLLDKEYDIPALSRYEETLGGMCKHIELFNGGSNEDDSKGKFIVYTGNVIKDFKLELNNTNETIVPEVTPQVLQDNKVIYTDVTTLPTYTRKTTDEKLLTRLLEDNEFKTLYEQGLFIKETDIDAETLETIRENEQDTSKKVFRLISILVANCQHYKTIDKLFRGSYFYKHTHWGTGKWDRLINTHNNSNPILSAYNTKVRAARATEKPDYTYFKTPYTTETYNQIKQEQIKKNKEERAAIKEEKEKIKELKKQQKLLEKFNIIDDFQKIISNIKNTNTELYDEYKKLDETFEVFDETDIDEDTILDERVLCNMYWKLFPYTFKADDNVRGNWIIYNKTTKLYDLLTTDLLQSNIINFFIDLFPNKNHTFRERLAKSTLTFYQTLNKPIINIYNNNSFLKLTNETTKGYYYKVKNGILDVLNCKLLNDTPNFLSFNELPFEIDDGFITALRNKNYKEYIKNTLFFTFLTHSFPNDLTKQELTDLINNPSLVSEEHDKFIFKYNGKNSTYRFSSQIKVLQRMLGYTMLPRHVYNSDKSLILYGVAGSGKSTLAKLLGYLLTGRKDLAGLTTTFTALERNQYALAPFKTTPLIVVNELPDKFSNEIRGTLNALISGESVEVNEKFKPNYSAQLPGKLILIGNVLPKIVDDSGSLARRSVIVNFSVNVSKTEQSISDIDNKLIESENLKAFFLFCLSGALDVLNHNYTVVSKIGLDLLVKMEKQNNPIEELLNQTVEFMTEKELHADMLPKNYAIPRTDLFSHLKTYIASSRNITNYTIKTWGMTGSKCQQIASVIAKHFNQPEYVIYCPMILGSKNRYKKHSNPVEAFRGIKLKDYELDDTTELEKINEVLNGSK